MKLSFYDQQTKSRDLEKCSQSKYVKKSNKQKKIRQTAAAEGISSIMTKVEMAKYIHLQIRKLFIICKCDSFSIWGANSIKTNLQTCNLPIGQSISYKSFRLKAVSIEFAPSNGKNVSHLQIHTFCHFDFFNNRRNGFSAVGASRRETRQESEEA